MIDINSGLPIEFATVYINGTTKGTLSDTKGRFKLDYKKTTCQFVVTHASYKDTVLNLDLNSDIELNLYLKPRLIAIAPVSVEGLGNRKENLEYFKGQFLGKDYWGMTASILNDGVVRFNVRYYDESEKDSSLNGKFEYFGVEASAPLIIHLPQLEYKIEYALVQFEETFREELGYKTVSLKGYSFFKPLDNPVSDPQMILRNRKNAYYNSTMHFVRSLYANKLSENGYRMQEINDDKNSNGSGYFTLDSCPDITKIGDKIFLGGLKGKQYIIKYYKRGIKSLNLTQRKNPRIEPRISYCTILSDKCEIRKDGTLPGDHILFSRSIVNKRIGASLPTDYEP